MARRGDHWYRNRGCAKEGKTLLGAIFTLACLPILPILGCVWLVATIFSVVFGGIAWFCGSTDRPERPDRRDEEERPARRQRQVKGWRKVGDHWERGDR